MREGGRRTALLVSYLSRGTRPECEIVGTDWCNTNAAKNQEKEKRKPRQVKKQNKKRARRAWSTSSPAAGPPPTRSVQRCWRRWRRGELTDSGWEERAPNSVRCSLLNKKLVVKFERLFFYLKMVAARRKIAFRNKTVLIASEIVLPI